MSAVYMHIAPNNKIYIGLTKSDNPQSRWGIGGKGYQTQKLFWKAINKYGWENFQHIVLVTGLSLEWACQIERDLIWKYKTQDSAVGYNISDGGKTNAGYHHTEEYKEVLRQRMIGRYAGEKNPNFGKPVPEEIKQKISCTLTGRKQSEETKQRKSQSLKGHTVSDETRAKISQGNKGKHVYTDEQRKKLSLLKLGKPTGRSYWKGKKFSDEHREHIRLGHIGKPKTEEWKKALSEAAKGKKKGPMSEEHKKAISEGHKRRRLLKARMVSANG